MEKFIFRSNFCLEEGDIVEKCAKWILITKASTGKEGLYNPNTGLAILEPKYDLIDYESSWGYQHLPEDIGITKTDKCFYMFVTELKKEIFLFDLLGRQINSYAITDDIRLTKEAIIVQNKKTKLYGVIETEHYKEILAPEFEKLELKRRGFFCGYKENDNKKYQIYTPEGNPILKEKAKKVSFSGNHISAVLDSKTEYYSYEGKLIISGNFKNKRELKEKYIRFEHFDDTFSLVDLEGNIILEPGIYSKINIDNNGYLVVIQKGSQKVQVLEM